MNKCHGAEHFYLEKLMIISFILGLGRSRLSSAEIRALTENGRFIVQRLITFFHISGESEHSDEFGGAAASNGLWSRAHRRLRWRASCTRTSQSLHQFGQYFKGIQRLVVD